ncbi:hypothetical protein I553_7592 [Mycobacterium xenopi 4042]|uniref:Uncharacterized protein n=1 Tax=Mycobacterium xenopi 4042 TaxID=1299334 RepID=X8AMP4_MYCXE|nr:hypothetical protein I553_7592 [Mycobacterium xenopi 4042]
MAAVVEAATVKDTDGNVIDTSEFFGKRRADEADEAEGSMRFKRPWPMRPPAGLGSHPAT